MYSFKPFGDQKYEKKIQDLFNSSFRSTMQWDTPHYRDGRVNPANIKHALVDPSHTFTYMPNHKTRRMMDFMSYTHKARDKSSEQLDREKLETFDFRGTLIRRLP